MKLCNDQSLVGCAGWWWRGRNRPAACLRQTFADAMFLERLRPTCTCNLPDSFCFWLLHISSPDGTKIACGEAMSSPLHLSSDTWHMILASKNCSTISFWHPTGPTSHFHVSLPRGFHTLWVRSYSSVAPIQLLWRRGLGVGCCDMWQHPATCFSWPQIEGMSCLFKNKNDTKKTVQKSRLFSAKAFLES